MLLVEQNCKQLGARKKQIDAVNKIVDCFVNGYSKEFLLSACCRFGKTTTAYIAVDTLAKVMNEDNYILLIVTALPGSVTDSWKDDAKRLFDIEVCNINDMDFTNTFGKHIILVSTQKAGKNKNKDTNELVDHKNVNEFIKYYNSHAGLKIKAMDESHVAGSTKRTLEFLDQLNADYSLDITATPFCEELITKYQLDTVNGDRCSYSCSQLDMLKFFEESKLNNTLKEDGFIGKDGKLWVPVKPRYLIEDLSAKALEQGIILLDDEDDPNASFVTTYINTIFSNIEEYGKYCDEFIDSYIIDFANKYGKNMIGFTSKNDIGNKIACYINSNSKYNTLIKVTHLAEKASKGDDNLSESSVARANKALAEKDNKIHLLLTCRKCGTGSTLHNLNTVLFLKGVSNYKEFMQYAARAFNPDEGKVYGNVVMFNPESCLQMLSYASGNKSVIVDPDDIITIDELLEFYEIYLDGKRLMDATEVISKLDQTYNRNSVLWPTLNEKLFDDPEIFKLISAEVLKRAGVTNKKDKEDSDDSKERKPSTPREDGDDKKESEKKDKKEVTKESLAKTFQIAFVTLIKGLATKYTEDEILDGTFLRDESKELNEIALTCGLCQLELWNIIVTNYLPKVLHKVYVYVMKVNSIEDKQNA